MTAKDERCDVCHGESMNSTFVGVAAVPAAPVSVAWCQNCLQVNAIPRFVAETWLFSEFFEQAESESDVVIPKKPPRKFPLADWAGEFRIWLGPIPGYSPLKECYKTLWDHEWQRRHA